MPYSRGMADLFASSRAKIKRAREHLDFLQADFKRFHDSEPYEIRHELHAEAGKKLLVYYPRAALSLDWSVIIGEILFNLRSAFDHVIYSVGGTAKNSEFPIFMKRADYFKLDGGRPAHGSGLGKIRGITRKETLDAIESLQPFYRREENEARASARGKVFIHGGEVLHKLCNIDKHRTLHLCRRQATKLEMRMVREVAFAGGIIEVPRTAVLDDRTVVASWRPRVLDSEVDVEAKVTFYIALDEGEVAVVVGKPVEKVCRNLILTTEHFVRHIELSL